MVDKFVICIRYLVTLRYALSDNWGFPFHSGISLGVVSSSQRTKGDKKTPATGGVPITGAKV